MPVSFLEQNAPMDARLKARQFVREFASHRYGLFKESGFRSDFAYPPFSSMPGLDASRLAASSKWAWLAASREPTGAATSNGSVSQQSTTNNAFGNQQQQQHDEQQQLRGFDDHWQECQFETSPASGLPANAHAANCAPYLVTKPAGSSSSSFNLMSADPFSYVDVAAERPAGAQLANQSLPVHWRELENSTRWHFCGENFPLSPPLAANAGQQPPTPMAGAEPVVGHRTTNNWFEHNQRAMNKQNRMCAERSALDVIRASEDFRRAPFG